MVCVFWVLYFLRTATHSFLLGFQVQYRNLILTVLNRGYRRGGAFVPIKDCEYKGEP